MERSYTVYKITNLYNNKCYIGSTTYNLKHRKSGHLSRAKHGSNHLIHKALRKYKPDNFTWEVIENCDTSEEMYDMEFHYIKQYNTVLPDGYNMTCGYDNTTLGYKFSDEARERQSKRMMGKNNTNYGVKWTEEQKNNLSKKVKGKSGGPNHHSKRPDVRKKASISKMGAKNPRALKWLLISPEGTQHEFTGGIKRHMKNLGLSYEGSIRHRKGLVNNYKGWIITNETIQDLQ